MATQKSQRIGIWIIAIVMIIGTIGSFAVIVLGNKNQSVDKAHIQQLTAEYQAAYTDYQNKISAQGDQLSGTYYNDFNQYSNRPAAFDAADAKELKKEDLKVGDGATLDKNSSFSAYYIGWNPKGEVFDSSIDGSKLKAPIAVTPGGVISGWTEGVEGMKVGGVRELTIPADKAYGAQGSGDKIPANTPLKFVIMVIPSPEKIAQPQPSQELINYYQKNSGQ